MVWGWRADASEHSHEEDFDLALREMGYDQMDDKYPWTFCLGTMCIMDWKRDSECGMSNVGVSTTVSRQPGMAVWLRTREMNTSGVTPGAAGE